ncbi:MAG: hypothetical protein KDB57_04575 [Solirubrobacterales bacterium]|nr:hypothetical protein [Solirubrobacterales bacterium]
MRGKLVFVAMLCLCGLGVSATASQAAQRWGITAINISPQIATDNDRYVSFQRRNRIPVVLDTWTGTIRAIRKAFACQPRDIGSRRVLLICPHHRSREGDTGFRAKTASVTGGEAKPLIKSRKIYDAYEIGKYWIPTSGEGPVYYSYLNWRTGRTKEMNYNVRSGIDLDRRAIFWADVQNFTPNFKGYPNPFFGDPVLCRGKEVVISDWKGVLRLWWDEDRSVKIGNGDLLYYGGNPCSWHQSLRIGSQWVTWRKGRSLHGYNFRTGARFGQRFAPGSKIAPLRDGVVVAKELKRYGKYYKAYRVRVIRR